MEIAVLSKSLSSQSSPLTAFGSTLLLGLRFETVVLEKGANVRLHVYRIEIEAGQTSDPQPAAFIWNMMFFGFGRSLLPSVESECLLTILRWFLPAGLRRPRARWLVFLWSLTVFCSRTRLDRSLQQDLAIQFSKCTLCLTFTIEVYKTVAGVSTCEGIY